MFMNYLRDDDNKCTNMNQPYQNLNMINWWGQVTEVYERLAKRVESSSVKRCRTNLKEPQVHVTNDIKRCNHNERKGKAFMHTPFQWLELLEG